MEYFYNYSIATKDLNTSTTGLEMCHDGAWMLQKAFANKFMIKKKKEEKKKKKQQQKNKQTKKNRLWLQLSFYSLKITVYLKEFTSIKNFFLAEEPCLGKSFFSLKLFLLS